MSDIETFRQATRAWLAENCPPEMREPAASESDLCWGGRRAQFQSEAQRLWLERMAERGGYGYGELCEYLGRKPETWEPLR